MVTQCILTIDIFCDDITSLVISDLHLDSHVIGAFQLLHFSKLSEFLFPCLTVEELCKTNLRTAGN